jgi:hypothetical protein
MFHDLPALERSAHTNRRRTMQTPILAIETTLRDGQTLAGYGREHPRPPRGWRAVASHLVWWLDHATGGKAARERDRPARAAKHRRR